MAWNTIWNTQTAGTQKTLAELSNA